MERAVILPTVGTRLGRSRLKQEGGSLGRRFADMRPGNFEVLPLVVDLTDPASDGELAVRLVPDCGVVTPATFPQLKQMRRPC